MKNLAVINAISLTDIALRPIVDSAHALERAVAFGKGLPGVEEVVVLCSRKLALPGGARAEARESWTVAELLTVLGKLAAGFDDFFYYFADCPFLDSGIAARMYQNHRTYAADYSFADGYPYGLAPEILRKEMPSRLQAYAGKVKSVNRETIFDLIRIDINSYDIETELAPADQRLLRVSLTADTERNFLLLKRLVSAGVTDAASACAFLDQHPETQRTLPAFFPIQIVDGCPQSCSYCPFPGFGGDIMSHRTGMSVDAFAGLLDKIKAFAGDAVIDISLWGEPSLHPEIGAIVSAVLERPALDLVIETSGIGWNPAVLKEIAQTGAKPSWIVSLDAASAEIYAKLRGVGFEEARHTTQSLRELFPDSVYVQAVRMKENEEDIESFFKLWKDQTDKLIIQKYDDFCGRLPARKVCDLSPVTRFPCWHLKRDLPVLLDGSVYACREDIGKSFPLGNAFTEELGGIWARGEALAQRHIAADYPELCSHCDEWYTYNF